MFVELFNRLTGKSQPVTDQNPLPVTFQGGIDVALPAGIALDSTLSAVLGAVTALQTALLARQNYTITQTTVTATTSSQTLIAANSNRKFLGWMVLGDTDVTIKPGSAVSAYGDGRVYTGMGANAQGGAEDFAGGVPTNAFYVMGAAAGSVIVVWEGA